MEEGMKPRAFQRMMRDFPFLWATTNSWSPEGTEIKAVFPDKLLFQTSHHFDDDHQFEIWAAFSLGNKKGFLEISKVKAPPGTRLGRAIFSHGAVPVGYTLEYVIMATVLAGIKYVTIYQAPRKTNFNSFVMDALKEVEEKAA